MIQVLKRAFDIIRETARFPERIWTLADLADLVHLPHDTCYHIVRSLCDYGYLESLGPRRGYVLGPELCALGHHYRYKKKLIERIQAPMEAFHKKFGVPITLSCMNNGDRYQILRIGQSKWGYNSPEMRFNYIYSATSLILISHLSVRKQKELLTDNPIPETEIGLQNSQSIPELLKVLKDIRHQPFVEMVHEDKLRKIACPVYSANGLVKHALGSYFADYRYTPQFRTQILGGLTTLATTCTAAMKECEKQA